MQNEKWKMKNARKMRNAREGEMDRKRGILSTGVFPIYIFQFAFCILNWVI
jgi:hypothetical protein